MRPPAVFVSSTFYDLRQIRADLRDFLASLGLEPILSEFTSFPVDPDASTFENCLKTVEQKADIFILIIGGRYGSVVEEGTSITNLEFLRAHAKGIPVYSFVDKSLLSMLPVWKANPDADFRSAVDTPKVFEFIGQIRDSGERWVFPFETAQDICGTLRTQLSYLFKDGLDIRSRVYGTDAVPSKLRHLSGEPMRLLIERPDFWEYLLFGETLRLEIEKHRDVRWDWEYGLVFGDQMEMDLSELVQWIGVKIEEGKRLWRVAEALLMNAFPKAVRPPGISGNPEHLYYVAMRLGEIYREVLKWKLDFHRLSIDSNYLRLTSLVSCLLDNTVREVEEYSGTMSPKLRGAITRSRTTDERIELNLTLTLTVPDMTELDIELARLSP